MLTRSATIGAILSATTCAYGYWTEFTLELPEGAGDGVKYEMRSVSAQTGTDYGWEEIPENLASLSLDDSYSSTTAAYRIAGDDSSTIVYKYDAEAEPVVVKQPGSGSVGVGIFWVTDIHTDYSKASKANKREFWDDAESHYERMSWDNNVLRVSNVMCDNVDAHVEVTDGEGKTETFDQAIGWGDAPGSFDIPVPAAYPVTVNASFAGEYPGSIVFEITGNEKVLYATAGDGPVPVADSVLDIQYCPD